MSRRISFVVTGRVQGVSYRASTQEAAERAKLVGWVRNRRDGAVEGEAEGEDAAIARFVEWLRHGPTGARVDELRTDELEPKGGRSFEIRW
jgi:acylphosphatase